MTKVEKVFDKGTPIRGKNPDVWRKDRYGDPIRLPSYGTEGKYGWHIDHIKPVAKGGSDAMRNLQPLHHETNREKSDTYPFKKK